MRTHSITFLLCLLMFLGFNSFNKLNSSIFRLAIPGKKLTPNIKKNIKSVSVNSNIGGDADTATSSIIEEASTTVSLSTILYEKLNLEKAGLSIEVLENALKGYEKLVSKGVVHNAQFLSIIDFSQSSRSKRFYLLDLKNMELKLNTFVSHGKNSGLDMAEKFSNEINSEQSSLGFYVTKETYQGKHGLSLRLSGLDQGFNNNAEARGVVVHAADYVNEGRVNSGYMGRSQGCPAFSNEDACKVINLIKGGSVLFLYHPSQAYLKNSKILNA